MRDRSSDSDLNRKMPSGLNRSAGVERVNDGGTAAVSAAVVGGAAGVAAAVFAELTFRGPVNEAFRSRLIIASFFPHFYNATRALRSARRRHAAGNPTAEDAPRVVSPADYGTIGCSSATTRFRRRESRRSAPVGTDYRRLDRL